MAERQIISGDAGTTWQNDTGKARYQFVAALINTCGVCLQYHLKIGNNWPIPIHYNCRCIQILVKPGKSAPHPFCDYRELLDKMSEADQAAAIGASNYRLLKSGLANWDDIVTKNRVRDFREVVAKKKLTVAEMVKHGVRKYQAEKAYASVHTSEHELVEQKRRELFQKITEAGVPHDKLVEELSKRLASRVTIAAGPTGCTVGRPQDIGGPAWSGGKLPGTGPSAAGGLAALLPKPKGPATPTYKLPPEATAPPAGVQTPKPIAPHPDELAEAIEEAEAKLKPPIEYQLPPEATAPPAGIWTPTPIAVHPGEAAKALGEAIRKWKPKAPPKPRPAAFPKIGDDLKVVRTLGGSTGAKLVEDKSGKQYVLKKGGNPGHLREEAAADELYRKMGFDVPTSKVYERADGPVKLLQFHAGQTLGELERTNPTAYRAAVEKLKKGFVADAVMGNWDVIGSTADNILVTPDGNVLRIDNGGSLRYRAQGSLKSGSQWTGTVGELSTMRSASTNSAAAKVFGTVTEAEIKSQIKDLLKRRASILKAAQEDVREVLGKRLDYLKDYAKPEKPIKVGRWKPSPAERFKTFSSTSTADAWGKEHYQNWKRGLTVEEKEAIQKYKNSSSSINRECRSSSSRESGSHAAEIAALDRAFAKQPLKEAVTVIRHFDLASVGLTYERVRPGMDIMDAGYVSTSLNPNHSWSGHRFEIRVPAGTHAGYVQIATGSHQSEYELTLGRNAERFRVVEMKRDEKRTIVLELVPNKPERKKK